MILGLSRSRVERVPVILRDLFGEGGGETVSAWWLRLKCPGSWLGVKGGMCADGSSFNDWDNTETEGVGDGVLCMWRGSERSRTFPFRLSDRSRSGVVGGLGTAKLWSSPQAEDPSGKPRAV